MHEEPTHWLYNSSLWPVASHIIYCKLFKQISIILTPSRNMGKSLVLGYLPVDIPGDSEFEIEAFDRRSRATLIKGAAYDQKRTKILC